MCRHLMRPARVCSSCRESDHETHELYSTLETQLLGVITKLACCAVTQMFLGPPSGAQTRSLSRNLDVLRYISNKEIQIAEK